MEMGLGQPDPTTLGVSAYPRAERDLYPTPPCLAQALVRNFQLDGVVCWEPAVGRGDLARIIRSRAKRLYETDIETGDDFLRCPVPAGVQTIVTNPPFNLLTAFIRRGLRHIEDGKAYRLILLARENADTAESRRWAFARAERRLVCTWRPRWIEGTTTSPRWSFVWWSWSADSLGPPMCHYQDKATLWAPDP